VPYSCFIHFKIKTGFLMKINVDWKGYVGKFKIQEYLKFKVENTYNATCLLMIKIIK